MESSGFFSSLLLRVSERWRRIRAPPRFSFPKPATRRSRSASAPCLSLLFPAPAFSAPGTGPHRASVSFFLFPFRYKKRPPKPAPVLVVFLFFPFHAAFTMVDFCSPAHKFVLLFFPPSHEQGPLFGHPGVSLPFSLPPPVQAASLTAGRQALLFFPPSPSVAVGQQTSAAQFFPSFFYPPLLPQEGGKTLIPLGEPRFFVWILEELGVPVVVEARSSPSFPFLSLL